jgi:ABC-type multidrug transport system fused ATPase/permease subunit
MLQVEHISFSYFDKKIINNLSFSLKKGENLAIIGESGSGKSTLYQTL